MSVEQTIKDGIEAINERDARIAELEAENERLRSELRVYNSDCQYPGCYCTTICDEVATEVLFRTGVVKALEWEDCSCGKCGRSYPVNFGTFYEGSGFDPIERALMDRAFAALEPALTEGDKSIRWIPSASTMEGIMSGRLKVGDKLIPEGQQPVAWRLDYPLGTQWCDDKYALQVAVDEGGAKVTPLYTHPSESSTSGEQVVTEAMVEQYEKAFRKASNGIAWFQVGTNYPEAVKEGLKAAMEAGR